MAMGDDSTRDDSTRDGASADRPRPRAGLLEVYEAGEVTVVGFGGQDVPSDACLADCREQLAALIREHGCRTLAFDLTGVKLLPSGLLGLIASARKLGVEVQVFNPSEDVREAFRTTHIDQLVAVREA